MFATVLDTDESVSRLKWVNPVTVVCLQGRLGEAGVKGPKGGQGHEGRLVRFTGTPSLTLCMLGNFFKYLFLSKFSNNSLFPPIFFC